MDAQDSNDPEEDYAMQNYLARILLGVVFA